MVSSNRSLRQNVMGPWREIGGVRHGESSRPGASVIPPPPLALPRTVSRPSSWRAVLPNAGDTIGSVFVKSKDITETRERGPAEDTGEGIREVAVTCSNHSSRISRCARPRARMILIFLTALGGGVLLSFFSTLQMGRLRLRSSKVTQLSKRSSILATTPNLEH